MIADGERELAIRLDLRDRLRGQRVRGDGGGQRPYIKSGRWRGSGGFKDVHLSGGRGTVSGTYSSTYNKKKSGYVRFFRDSTTGLYTGEWGEPPAKWQGVTEKIVVSNGGKTITLNWRVTVPGRLKGRKLPMLKGRATLTWKGVN